MTYARPDREYIRDFPINRLMRNIRIFRELGRVSRVQMYLQAADDKTFQSADSVVLDELNEHRKWLIWAVDHESEYGKGSLVNKSHPIYLAADERVRRFRLNQKLKPADG